MFDKLLEKIQKIDEIENKLLSIFEGKTLEQISLLRHLSQTQYRKVDECVCHIYGLSDEKLLEFYGSMGDDWNAFNEPYGSDKTEVEAEIEKRGLDVREDGKKFGEDVPPIGGIGESIKEFFDHKYAGKDEEYLITHARSRFGQSKLADVLCKEAVKVNESTTWVTYYNDLSTDPPTEVEMKGRMLAATEQDALVQAEKLLNKEAPGGEWEVARAKKVSPFFQYESKVNENLTDHARRELELAGMFDEEVDGSEAMGSWNKLCAEAVLELMEVFAEQGHSGFSASMTQDLFSRLAKYENLTELTDNPDEWMDVSEFQSGKPGWQSQRSPSCFSEDAGKTYWDIDEDWNKYEDEDGSVWSGGLSEEEWDNRPTHQSKHFEKKE